MHTQQLSPHQVEPSHAVERSEEAAIESEIAVRLLELREVSGRTRAIRFIGRLHALTQIDREAVWVVLRIMTGDLSEITAAYATSAEKEALDKQAVQQRMERAIVSIRLHFPELAEAIVQLRHITAEAGKPQKFTVKVEHKF